MKKKLLLATTLLFCAIIVTAQNTSPYWSLAGNSNTTSGSKLGTTNNNSLKFYTNNVKRMTIDSTTGYVGIGNNVTGLNASRILNLVDDNAVMRILRVHPTSAPAVELLSRTSANGPDVAYWDMYAQPSDASFRIRDRQTGTNFDRLTISHTNGNVGIGTTNPLAKLHLSVNEFSAYSGLAITNTNSDGKTITIHQGVGGKLLFTEPDVATVMALDFNTRNVGIGTFSPNSRLVVTDNRSYEPTMKIQNLFAPRSNGYKDGLYIQAGTNVEGGGSFYVAFQRPDGRIIGAVDQGTPYSVRYLTMAHERLDPIIHETKLGLADVKKIQVTDYNFSSTTSKQTGFIAQQLYEVFPEAVSVGGEDPIQRPWMVDYGRVTPLLVKAIQDLSVQNDAKESTIVTMQQQSNIMQQQINTLAEALKNLKALVVNGTNGGSINSLSGYLKQNIPNPANNSTVIGYYLPENTVRGEIRITDLKGISIKSYKVSKGDGQFSIASNEIAAGVYIYSLYADNKRIDSRQMVINR